MRVEKSCLAEESGEVSSDRGEGELLHPFALGPAEMGCDGDSRAVVDQVLDCRQRSPNARVIFDLVSVQFHVELTTDKDLP